MVVDNFQIELFSLAGAIPMFAVWLVGGILCILNYSHNAKACAIGTVPK